MAQRDKDKRSNVRQDSTQPSSGPAGTFVLSAVVACFVLSGFAALLYQTAWLRQFSLVFGTSELAVATVLAAYMGAPPDLDSAASLRYDRSSRLRRHRSV